MDTRIILWFRGVRVYEHYEPQFPQFGTPYAKDLGRFGLHGVPPSYGNLPMRTLIGVRVDDFMHLKKPLRTIMAVS